MLTSSCSSSLALFVLFDSWLDEATTFPLLGFGAIYGGFTRKLLYFVILVKNFGGVLRKDKVFREISWEYCGVRRGSQDSTATAWCSLRLIPYASRCRICQIPLRFVPALAALAHVLHARPCVALLMRCAALFGLLSRIFLFASFLDSMLNIR
ncbi:hypothetical protein HAX54_015256 [Datura stramonium]|uniref:Secreted protein n=1 Tax=Datura stramonium TaxID=4076 RepID=A0ABS8TRS6_DATST|nr:hypothetical protein [Datura stramonium]